MWFVTAWLRFAGKSGPLERLVWAEPRPFSASTTRQIGYWLRNLLASA